MAIPVPVGTLCHIRSSFWGGMALNGLLKEFLHLLYGSPAIAEKMDRKGFCELSRKTHGKWRAMNFMLRNAEDFQARECFKVMEAYTMREGITMDMVDAGWSWKIDKSYATLNGRMPPPPPTNVDATVLQRVRSVPFFRHFTPALPPPINPDGSDTDLIKEEYVALLRDHTQLITMGKNYGSFDPLGKDAFLSQMDAVGERWSVFLTRLQLMGKLNPDYLRQVQELATRLGVSVADFNTLLHRAHRAMREDAERERLQR